MKFGLRQHEILLRYRQHSGNKADGKNGRVRFHLVCDRSL